MILEKNTIAQHSKISLPSEGNVDASINYHVEIIEVRGHIQCLLNENVSLELCTTKRDKLIHALSVAKDHQLNSLTKEIQQTGEV